MQAVRSDENLVRATLQGNEEAFSELADRYRSAAFGVAFSRLGDFETARDVAQDALVQAYLELPTLCEPAKFANWFYQIALRTALGAGRRLKDLPSINDPDVPEPQATELDPEEALQRSENSRQVREALDQLAEPDRLTLILHYVDGYSHEEIGSMTGASVPSVKSRIYRARRKLRQEMLEMVEKSLKDERSPDIKDAGVIVEWFGAPCYSLCDYYYLPGQNRHKSVPFEETLAIAERFVHWKDAKGLHDFSVDIVTGYSNKLPEFAKAAAFNRKHGTKDNTVVGTDGMYVVNGCELMTEDEITQILPAFKKASPGGIWLKFFGPRDYHDRIAGRKGDFDQLMLIGKLAGEYGLQRHEQIPLWKSVIDKLPELMDELDSLPGPYKRSIYLLPYYAQTRRLETERPTLDDVDRIPEPYKQYLRNGGVKPHKTEAEWMARIASGNYAGKTTRYYVLPVWEDNIDWLESSDPDDLLQHIRQQDDLTYQAIPSLPTLADLYGKKNGRKLYWGRDLEWKWIDLHLKAHPEIDPTGRFDDLKPTILWR